LNLKQTILSTYREIEGKNDFFFFNLTHFPNNFTTK